MHQCFSLLKKQKKPLKVLWMCSTILFCCLGGWNQSVWLVPCRRQGMLTQGPAPDLKCKLNISSFLTLPHLSDCLISTRNSVSIVFLLEMVEGWDRSGGGGRGDGCLITGCGRGDREWVLSCSFCFCLFNLCLCCLFSRVLCPFVLRD